MKKALSFISFLLVFALLTTPVGAVEANIEQPPSEPVQVLSEKTISRDDTAITCNIVKVETDANKAVTFHVDDEVISDISTYELLDLADDLKDDEKIDIVNIHGLHDIAPESAAVPQKITGEQSLNTDDAQLQVKWYDLAYNWELSWTYYTSCGRIKEYQKKDDFVISVARGQTKTLSSKYSASIGGSYEASVGGSAYGLAANLKNNLNWSIACEISKTVSFSGPDNGSCYNSREYRVRYYERRGTYTYKATGCQSGHTSVMTGTFKEPLRYLEYSIDHKVS